MANEIFVDTSGFYACVVRGDDGHRQAAAYLKKSAKARRQFVTTDYILDETATLLKMRGQGHLVMPVFDIVFASAVCRVEWMDPQRFAAIYQLFSKFQDQGYSFTDCFSFYLMKQLRLKDALTKDEHFRQAGFHPLLI